VLFGGRSAEHDVSRVSARHVLSAIDPDRYEVVPVGITREGRWQLAEAAAELLGSRGALPASVDVAGPATDAMAIARAHPDSPTVVIPVLHGPYGEDGTVQGLLEMADLPYVGAGVLGSAVAMDKAMAKTVLDAAGVPQPRWREVVVTEVGDHDLPRRLLDELGPVVFVKPANMGSSIGVSRADDEDSVAAALVEAARYDERLVVEEGIGGVTVEEGIGGVTVEKGIGGSGPARELECGVLGNLEPRASVVGEIIPAAEFYDYADKYHDGAARTVIPADIADDVSEHVRELAVRTFRALRAEGMARVDVFLAPDDGTLGPKVLVNEINTFPGFTPISMFPKLWAASGLAYPDLIDELVRLALERHERRSRFETGR